MTDRRSTRRLLAGAAVVTVLVGFALGYGLASRRAGSARVDTAVAPTTAGPGTTEGRPAGTLAGTTTAPPGTPAPAPPTTATPTTGSTTTETTPSTTAPPATVTATVTVAAPTTTRAPVVTAAPTVPRVPSTLAPPDVQVLYAADAQNRLVIPRTGTATLTIRNRGGSASQWLVTGSGFSVRSVSQGTLEPGQSATVVVGPPPGDLPRTETTGTISVLGATNSQIGFVIPRA